ncbi:hypothetical protein LTR85_002723 [Meristemomyces frigidus]|nr:hypothetical protein LTR85_002723 [Meristemomyces frigidus]
MATYAEYQQQTMASENNDFTLYPYQEPWTGQAYLPTSFADNPYVNPTAFESFHSQQTYGQPGPQQFSFNTQSYQQAKNHLQPQSPTYSPSNSASHSFDYQQPPILSSTSDSGASVQSTISSAMGSPSLQQQPSSDWSQQQQQQHMTMVPSIMHHDSIAQDLFGTTTFDLETIPATDKGCVGEFTNISSSQQTQTVSPFYLSSLPFSFDSPQSAQHSGYQSWSLQSSDLAPNAAYQPVPFPTTLAPQPLSTGIMDATSPNDSMFRSPTTPASATSPVLERVKGKRRASVAPQASKRVRASSPLATSMSYHESDVPPRPQAPLPTLTSPFFSQSSGHFVPPLESSYPSLIQPFSPTQLSGAQFPEMQAVQSPRNMAYPQAPSPVPSKHSIHSPRGTTGKIPSPYMRTQPWQPYPAYPGSRRQSVSSVHSRHSQGSLSSDDSNKGLCTIPTCGRHVKDLKAHMLTHQNERPEKCPIPTCEYHNKGFARKYDKNRHTLTHYKGTMVCGFCPGSGSAAEKSFNRADVFKRHLTSVHGVEQTPPNARRKSPTTGASKRPFGAREASGMCSTCGITFPSAQDFYEHLDDCVLRVVQQTDPSEAINEKLLSSVAEDKQVQETMERHMLPSTIDLSASTSFDDEEEVDEDEEVADEDDANDGTYGSRNAKSGKGALKSRKAAVAGTSSVSAQHVGGGNHVSSGGAVSKPNGPRRGLTYSKNGVPLAAGTATGKGSKRRKNYPLSWGAQPEKMKMKKRVLCVYDGQRRLWKDDMMLDADHEVRIPLPGMGDGRAWVTDLDIQTLNRAEGLHNATEEEKGPWDPELDQLLQ